MNTYSLREILEIVENDGLTSLDEDGRNKLIGFVRTLDDAGTESLKGLERENIVGTVLLLKALISFVLIQQGDFKEVSAMMFTDIDFDKILVLAMKFSVGLATMEEWR